MKRIFALLLIYTFVVVSAVTVCADAPKNQLLNTKWAKAMGKVEVSEKVVGGEKITTMSGMDSSYATAAIDIMPTIEKLMGDKDEIDVWIVLDVRVDCDDGEEFPFGMKIRADGTSELVKTEEAFNENYTEATTFRHRGGGGISISAYPSGTLTNQWQRIEIQQNFTAFDLNKDFWKRWNLCFNSMSAFEDMGAIQIKNVGIYLFNEYESVTETETEKTETDTKPEDKTETHVTPAPVKIYKPYGFDKYTVNFAETMESDMSNVDIQEANIKLLPIIIAGIAIVAVACGTVIFMVTKK